MSTKTPTADQLRAAIMAATATPKPHGRGRPPALKTGYDLARDPSYKLALEVQRLMLKDPKPKGAQTRALTKVADKHQMSVPTLKKKMQRRPEAREFAQFSHDLESSHRLLEEYSNNINSMLEEVEKRLGNAPEDVRDFLYRRLALVDLWQLLRKEKINGYTPGDFCKAVREASKPG